MRPLASDPDSTPLASPRSGPGTQPRFLVCLARGPFHALTVSLVLLWGGTAFSASAPEPAAVDFLRDVRPILASHCFKCHGPDEKTRKGGLRLDLGEAAVRPAKSGRVALVPGKPGESELVRRLEIADEEEVMPPPSTKRPLTPAQKEVLRHWVADGGEYRPHWAFVPPVRPEVPVVPAPRPGVLPAQNAIDAFVRARLAEEGLEPSPEADRATLLRRLSLDLIGLPPTPEEAEAFLSDTASGAYERQVERLLQSRHYGERWARRWLDLARYADTNGYEKDRPRSMWAWRDWVIEAFNQDMPFDQFTVRQLAGDLLPGATASDRIATGFHRNTMLNEEGGVDPLEFRFYAMVDRVHTTATTWLGMTMACAQCHTHKYDPIQQRDYYGFMAYLDNADEPVMDVPDPAIEARRREAEARIAALTAALPDRFPVEEILTWVTPPAVRVVAESGAPAERLEDGSYRFGGTTPDRDTYSFELEVPAGSEPVIQLNVEALADEALPQHGPGRAPNGNFVLSELELRATTAGSEAWQPVSLTAVSADFEQSGFPVAAAVDGKPGTGWAISGQGAWNLNRRATFRLAAPLQHAQGSRLEIRLRQAHGSQHVLGRLRLALGQGRALARPEEELRREHFARKFEAWRLREADRVRAWTPLRPVFATSNIPVLTVQEDLSVFVSSDMTKSDTYRLGFRSELKGVTAFRLEALPDDRLPRRGPGRVAYEGPFGDFFLSTFRVRAGGQPLRFSRASQTHASGGNTAAKALDEDEQSGWAIDGGQGRVQVAVFQLEAPVDLNGEFEVAMLFEKYYAAGLGRFRLSVTTDPRGSEALAWPDDLQQALRLAPEEWTVAQRDALRGLFASTAPELAAARAEIEKIRREMPAYPTTLVLQERPPENPRLTRLRNRGEFLQPGEAVPAGLPAVFASLVPSTPRNRLEFARWLVSRENPLTARVTMNRQWAALFGRGLVRTAEDFGFQGELPSHPALLDWLAVEFMDRGWSQKEMVRLLVRSATYRQSARVDPTVLEKDPQNRLLARAPRFRLEAELVRDLALRAAGLLSPKVGGPSVFPPQLASITREGTYGPLDWVVSRGEDRYRRGLYTFAKRTAPYATFGLFDAPSGEACLARREVSNTPLQSLALLNDEVFVEAAQALARGAIAASPDDAARVRFLFRRVLTRDPEPDELDRVLAFQRSQHERLSAARETQAADLAGEGEGDVVGRATWTAVARALLNLDETVTRG